MGIKINLMRPAYCCTIALFSWASAAALGAGDEVPFEPGLWEIKSTSESALPGAGGEDIDTSCITTDLFSLEETTSLLESTLPGSMCEVDRSASGNTLEVSMVCTGGGGTMTGDGSYTVSDEGKSMVGEMLMTIEVAGTPVEIKTVAAGKWVGEC